MAHRIITQVVLTGGRILGRAFAESYRQAAATQKYAAANKKNGGGGGGVFGAAQSSMSMEEACKILNVSPPRMGQTDLEAVTERFKKLFDLNDPKKGGSFYLQSKILRARERIEADVRSWQEAAEKEAELEGRRNPKLYR